MKNAKELYKEHYEFYRSGAEGEYSKYEWAADEIFQLCTYDSGLDEIFVRDILEVCKVILDWTNFEYISNRQNYLKYILVCQLLNEFRWIDWGTSIRGAWFDGYDNDARPILEAKDWYECTPEGLNEHTMLKVSFNKDNIKALIEFMEE